MSNVDSFINTEDKQQSVLICFLSRLSSVNFLPRRFCQADLSGICIAVHAGPKVYKIGPAYTK